MKDDEYHEKGEPSMAFPVSGIDEYGLTKREYFAIHILQGMLSDGCTTEYRQVDEAIETADKLIERLARK